MKRLSVEDDRVSMFAGDGYAFHEREDENHWILKPQNSRLWYREFFAWLRRFDPGGRAAST